IEMGRSPEPFAIANVEIIYGNKTIAYIKNLGIQLSAEWTPESNTVGTFKSCCSSPLGDANLY
ncbi:hypothetical protein, partial [Nostoc sp. CHAB 5715]|uniref:hypothetical protein n=1 Tax=Nostoc sp. CHAB 5715 TaxID=2780400 RepID=UPI001E4F5F6F